MKENGKRFIKVYTQGMMEGIQIWVDRQTGVYYLFQFSGYSGGITPLLDENGKPMIATEEELAQLTDEQHKKKKSLFFFGKGFVFAIGLTK